LKLDKNLIVIIDDSFILLNQQTRENTTHQMVFLKFVKLRKTGVYKGNQSHCFNEKFKSL